jgi:ferredoxin
MSKGILYDATMGIGCKQCEQACATENGLPYDDTIAAQNVTSAHKYTTVLTKDDKFMRKLCMNCDDPACASVCPVGALKKTALGPVTYDKHKVHGMPLLRGGLPPLAFPSTNGTKRFLACASALCARLALQQASLQLARKSAPPAQPSLAIATSC